MEPQAFGPYTLLSLLGTGGMAEVFLARAPSEGGFAKLIALKRLLGTFNSDPQLVSMLADEARVSVWLNHSNIVQVLDFGIVDETHYIAMEFVDGCDLTRLIRDRRKKRSQPLPLPTAIFVAQQIAEALDHAHRRRGQDMRPLGIIHRDVSPHNVLISREGQVKLADFGLARTSISVHRSVAGVIRGKFAYMPKEQAHGKTIDHRIDIFAAGVTLYEALTGVRPYTSANLAQQLYQLEQAVPPPSTHIPDIPPEIDDLALQAISPSPQDRYASAAEMADDLAHALAQLSTPNQEAQHLAALVAAQVPVSPAKGFETNELRGPLLALDTLEHSLIEDDLLAAQRTFSAPMVKRPRATTTTLPSQDAKPRGDHAHAPFEAPKTAKHLDNDKDLASQHTPVIPLAALAPHLEAARPGVPVSTRHRGAKIVAASQNSAPPDHAFVAGSIGRAQTSRASQAHDLLDVKDLVEALAEEDDPSHDTLIDESAVHESDPLDGARTIRRSPDEALEAFNRALAERAAAQAELGPIASDEHDQQTRGIRRDTRSHRSLALFLAAIALVGLGLAGGWILREEVRTHRQARARSRGDIAPPEPPTTITTPKDRETSAGRNASDGAMPKATVTPLAPRAPKDAMSSSAERRPVPDTAAPSSGPASRHDATPPTTRHDATPPTTRHDASSRHRRQAKTRRSRRRGKPTRPRMKQPPSQGPHTQSRHRRRQRPPRGAKQALHRKARGMGRLIVTSETPAQIFIDKRSAGTTPVRLQMPPGIYRIKALAIGKTHFNPTRFVTTERGQVASLRF